MQHLVYTVIKQVFQSPFFSHLLSKPMKPMLKYLLHLMQKGRLCQYHVHQQIHNNNAKCRLLGGEPAQMSHKTRSGRKPTTCTSPKPAVILIATLTSQSQTWWLHKYSSRIYTDAMCGTMTYIQAKINTKKMHAHLSHFYFSVHLPETNQHE